MDENLRKGINQLSVLEMVNKIQIQNKLTNPTIEISEKLANAMQQMNPVGHLVSSAMNQNLLSQLSHTFPPNRIALDNAAVKMMESLTESTSLNTSLFESIRLNTSFIDAIVATHLGLKPQAQFIFPEGFSSKSQVGDLSNIMSKATEVLKQYDQFSELESFRAISRLKNFPFEDIVPTVLNDLPELRDNTDGTILELDSKISDKLSLVEDFNELSIENQNFLLDLYRTYYYPIIVNCLITLIWLKSLLDESIDLSDNIFTFVKTTKGAFSYIGNNIHRPNSSAIIDNIIAGGILILLAKIIGW